MGLLITLRDDASISYFREIIIGIIETKELGVDRIIFSSGYFTEPLLDIKNKNGKTLVDAIVYNKNIKEIKIVGSMQEKTQFNSFVGKLKRKIGSLTKVSKSFCPLGVKNWHAKMCFFIPKGKNNWSIAIVGSSNMSAPAFGISSKGIFNVESDVTIWRDNNAEMSKLVDDLEDENGIIFQSDQNVNTIKIDEVYNKLLKIPEDEE